MVTREILGEQLIHPAIRQQVSSHFRDTVEEVKNATTEHRIVIVGMSGNPIVSKARKILHDQAIAYKYLEYGSYFSQWRRRNSIKMWTGWPTFPMIFLDGVLIGGYQDLESLVHSAELARQLAAERTQD
jgi:monothiol glutaredoxin